MSEPANIYAAPQAAYDEKAGGNTSGLGKLYPTPPEISGWSWGAFFLNWIWAIGNRTWIGLLALVPYVGFIMCIALGVKGREWAWQYVFPSIRRAPDPRTGVVRRHHVTDQSFQRAMKQAA